MRFTNLQPVYVDALLLASINADGPVFDTEGADVPDWIVAALAKPDNEEGAVYARDNQVWIVSGSHIRLYPGDWLIRNEDGELAAMQTSDFAKTYMPASLAETPATFDEDLRACLNRWSAERTGGNTPDFLLSEFIIGMLRVLGVTILRREAWYGRGSTPAQEAAIEGVSLIDAMKGAHLIEEGSGWVKVHGIPNNKLFKLLTEAKEASG